MRNTRTGSGDELASGNDPGLYPQIRLMAQFLRPARPQQSAYSNLSLSASNTQFPSTPKDSSIQSGARGAQRSTAALHQPWLTFSQPLLDGFNPDGLRGQSSNCTVHRNPDHAAFQLVFHASCPNNYLPAKTDRCRLVSDYPDPPNSCPDLSQAVCETPQEARPVRAFLFLAIRHCLPIPVPRPKPPETLRTVALFIVWR